MIKDRKTYVKHIDLTPVINVCLNCKAEKCNGECAKIKEATKEFVQNRQKIKKEISEEN